MSEENEGWYRLDLLVDEGSSVNAASLLWEIDAAGVEIQDHETYADDESVPGVPEGANRLVTYFHRPELNSLRELEQEVVNHLTEAEIVPLAVECGEYTDRSWETSWKDYFRPTDMSPRVVVGPPWEDFEAPEGGTKIVIEPGMAFGTGTHETTQLCADTLDRLLAEAEHAPTVLDVGCGSAILSMIAARLGAARVVGIDVDETAVEVAKENLRVNRLEDAVELSTTPVEDVAGQFDIVVANILTHILLHIRQGLQQRVAPGGVLLLSGITEEQVDEVRAEFVGPGWSEVGVGRSGEWVSFELRKEAA